MKFLKDHVDLKKRIKVAGYSHKDLAYKVGLSPSNMSSQLSGFRAALPETINEVERIIKTKKTA